MVKLPWGTASIVEVVSVAQPNHSPYIELLQFPDGKLALRFAAYYKGKPVQGPLVLDQDSIQHVARAAAHSQGIKPLLKHLAGGPAPLPQSIILVPLPIEDLGRPTSNEGKPTGRPSRAKKSLVKPKNTMRSSTHRKKLQRR